MYKLKTATAQAFILAFMTAIFTIFITTSFGASDWKETSAKIEVKSEKITDHKAFENSFLDLLIKQNNMKKEDALEPTTNTIKIFEVRYHADVQLPHEVTPRDREIVQIGILKTLDPSLREEVILKGEGLKVRYNPSNPVEIEFVAGSKIYPAPPLATNKLEDDWKNK